MMINAAPSEYPTFRNGMANHCNRAVWQLAVISRGGVYALAFPCRRVLGGWVNAMTNEPAGTPDALAEMGRTTAIGSGWSATVTAFA
jgi:hypothetical protein